MAEVVVSAPGKVILHGEHAVVYGKRAVAGSLNLRTYLKISPTDGDIIQVSLPDIGLQKSWTRQEIQAALNLPLCDVHCPKPASDEITEALKVLTGLSEDTAGSTRSCALTAFLYLFCSITATDSLPAARLLVSSHLPPSAGLGSSAAYSTCLAAGLLTLSGHISAPMADTGQTAKFSDSDTQLINRWAFQGEKLIHGTPSGIDNSVSTYGGALCFQSGTITPLTSVPELRILLTNTAIPRSTKVLVAGVKAKFNKYPEIIRPVLESIEAISDKCQSLLKEMAQSATEDHYNILKDLIDMNQHHLAVLGVSHPSLDDICHMTSRLGLASKLTGAGGGGCTFTLLPPDVRAEVMEEVERKLQVEGYTSWRTVIGGPGVRLHSSLSDIGDLPPTFTSPV